MVLFAVGFGAADCVETDDSDRVYQCNDDDALELFEGRIAPLLASDRPSTCNQCHLAGVDLGMYAQADPCATMACMVESGIVDLAQPDDSVVLSWILRAEGRAKGPENSLITDEVVRAEHDAVLQWIEYNASCGADVCATVENPCGGVPAASCEIPPSSSLGGRRQYDDPGDCSDHTLEAGFAALIYSWRGRCSPCHVDSHVGAPEDAPRWVSDGSCEIGSLSTMRNVIDSGLLDADNPSQSLLLLKPLSVEAGGVEHGGHDKMATVDDPSYRDYLTWIERWADCQP